MKRKRTVVAEPCRYQTHLERMTHDSFRHVCSFLGFADLHALYRAVVVMQTCSQPHTNDTTGAPTTSRCAAAVGGHVLLYASVPLLGGVPLHTELTQLTPKLQSLLAQESVRRLQQVASRDGTELLPLGYANVGCSVNSGVYAYENAKVLANMKAVLCDPCHYTRLLRCTEACSCCGRQFGITTYWAQTADPLHLCNACRFDLNSTRITDSNPQLPTTNSGGWCWISASKLKVLCQVPSATKASVFAHTHGIRTRSSVNVGERVSLLHLSDKSQKKEFYFYKDVLRYLSGG